MVDPSYFEEIANKHIARIRKEKELDEKFEKARREKEIKENRDIRVIAKRGHYEVFINGKLCGSGDTYNEALQDVV